MNSQSFCREDVKKGLHLKFIKTLIEIGYEKSDKCYNDIHICTDGETLIVEWVDKSFDYDEGDGFKFVDYDQKVMTECNLPDNSTVMCYDEDEVKETLDNWLKDHQGWRKTEYGTWVNDIKNAEMKKWWGEETHKEKEKEK